MLLTEICENGSLFDYYCKEGRSAPLLFREVLEQNIREHGTHTPDKARFWSSLSDKSHRNFSRCSLFAYIYKMFRLNV